MVPADGKRRKLAQQSADALDDDLEYEVDSDAAGDEASVQASESDAEGVDMDGSGNEGASSARPTILKKSITTEEKRRRRQERKSVSKKRKLEELGNPDEIDSDILNVDQQADLFARLIRDNPPSKDLTKLELADMSLSSTAFIDTSAFSGPRNLSTITKFIEKYTRREDLSSSNKEPGRPHTLVICSSAIRVADLTRSLKHLNNKTSIVMKLFGKEKQSKQAEQLQNSRISIAVGVPGRTLSLLKEGSLKAQRMEQIYIDHSYKNPKKRGIMQIKEIVLDVMKLIEVPELRERLDDGSCKIILF